MSLYFVVDQGYYLHAEVTADLDIPDSSSKADQKLESDNQTDNDEEWDGFGMDDLENILNVQVTSCTFLCA